jgi:hypothetical protein
MSDGRVARLLEDWRAAERRLQAIQRAAGEEWAVGIEEAKVEAARLAYQEAMATTLEVVLHDEAERAS